MESAEDSRHLMTFINAGSGPPDDPRLPSFFSGWRQIRVDLDPEYAPDIEGSIVDLSAVPDGSVDAVWSAHCLEHLYGHEVPIALSEFRRVLSPTGFACIIVPDLQAIAHWIQADRLHESIYQSAAGPVTAHDMIWGFGSAIAAGKASMAHRCGFAPTLLSQVLQDSGFVEIVLRRRPNLEIAALALPAALGDQARREQLMTNLGL